MQNHIWKFFLDVAIIFGLLLHFERTTEMCICISIFSVVIIVCFCCCYLISCCLHFPPIRFKIFLFLGFILWAFQLIQGCLDKTKKSNVSATSTKTATSIQTTTIVRSTNKRNKHKKEAIGWQQHCWWHGMSVQFTVWMSHSTSSYQCTCALHGE